MHSVTQVHVQWLPFWMPSFLIIGQLLMPTCDIKMTAGNYDYEICTLFAKVTGSRPQIIKSQVQTRAKGLYVNWMQNRCVKDTIQTCPLPNLPCVSTKVTTLTSPRSTSKYSWTSLLIVSAGHQAPPLVSVLILRTYKMTIFHLTFIFTFL